MLSNGEKNLSKVIGKSLFYASIQVAISSMEMGSKYVVKDFIKDQRTLDEMISSLKTYIIVGVIWLTATAFILHSDYGMTGLVCGVIANLVIMSWLYVGYYRTIRKAARKYNLRL
jgi:hypothetical protein